MNNNEPTTHTIPQFSVIDNTTGEIVNQYFPGDRVNITRKSQLDYVNNHVLDFNKEKSFVKIYDEVVPLLEKYLTQPEFKFTICLTPHISYEDCIIRRTQNRNSDILTLKDLAEIHGYKYGYVRKIMSSLKNKGIIGKHETGNILAELSGTDEGKNIVYTVNPYVYFRGTNILTPVHSFYQNSGWEELLKANSLDK